MTFKRKQMKEPAEGREELLWDYLNNRLSVEDKSRIEQEIARDPFLKDALDGLSDIEDEQVVRSSVLLLQQQLRRHIQNRKKRQPVSLQPRLWIWVSVLALLLFVFIAWWVISYLS